MINDNVIRAFSEDHVGRLTGLSKSQLRYWDKTGFFSPTTKSRGPYNRTYSFRDIVGLRTLGLLRKQYQVSLQHLRKVAEDLSDCEAVWADTTLYVLNKQVYFNDPTTGRVRNVGGQYAATIPLVQIMNDVREDTERLRKRSVDQLGKIERNRYIARNAWVVAGTRIPTKAIVRFNKAGYSADSIIREYPSLTPSDIEAALDHEEKLAKRA